MGRLAKVKLALKSASRALGRAYRRMSAYKPSTLIFALAAVAVAIFLFGGGLYNVVQMPPVAIFTRTGILIAYPLTLLEQLIIESIISMILFALGFAGVLLIYDSTKYADDPQRAYYRFVIGIALLWISYILCRYLLWEWHLKAGGR